MDFSRHATSARCRARSSVLLSASTSASEEGAKNGVPERQTPTSPCRQDWKSFSGEPSGKDKEERVCGGVGFDEEDDDEEFI